jgi:hypothetical protein
MPTFKGDRSGHASHFNTQENRTSALPAAGRYPSFSPANTASHLRAVATGEHLTVDKPLGIVKDEVLGRLVLALKTSRLS